MKSTFRTDRSDENRNGRAICNNFSCFLSNMQQPQRMFANSHASRYTRARMEIKQQTNAVKGSCIS